MDPAHQLSDLGPVPRRMPVLRRTFAVGAGATLFALSLSGCKTAGIPAYPATRPTTVSASALATQATPSADVNCRPGKIAAPAVKLEQVPPAAATQATTQEITHESNPTSPQP